MTRLYDFMIAAMLCAGCLAAGVYGFALDAWRKWFKPPEPAEAEPPACDWSRFEICTVSLDTGRVVDIPGDPAFASTSIMWPDLDDKP